MTSTKTKPETLKAEIIAEEIPLEKVIDNTLVKNNVTDSVIAVLKEKYSGLKLVNLTDKESYLEICEARKDVRKNGIIVEKLCKIGREDAIKIQKLWLSKEKEILAKIAEVQDPLDAEIKKYEDEQARIEAEEYERKEQEYMSRQTTLLKMEAKYENNCFVLGGVSYEVNNIKEADKEIWEETILPKYKREFDKIESVRAEEEKLKEAAANKLREEQAELLRQQEDFKRQQAEFQKQQEELQKQRDEVERKDRAEKEKVANELREKQDAQNKARMQQVMGLGLVYSLQYKSFVFEDVAVAEVDIVNYDQEKWNNMIVEITPTIQRNKEELAKREQEKRDKEIENAKQEGIIKEQLRQKKIEADNQRLAEEKKVREAEELAKASDKDKWTLLVQQIVSIVVPEFKSPTYRGKANIAKEKIEEIESL